MNFQEVVTPPPAICNGFSTQKAFWEEKFTPLNVPIFGRCNVMNHRDIKNGEQYIILDISSKLDLWTRGKSPLQNKGVI